MTRIALSVLLIAACGKEDATPQLSEPTLEVHEQMGSILRVRWEQDVAAAVWVEFSVDEGVWLQGPVAEREAGAAEDLVLGVPFAAEVAVRLAWDGGQGPSTTIVTGDLPEGAPRPTVVDGDPGLWDASSPYVLVSLSGGSDSVDGAWTVIVDRSGRAVWARPAADRRINMQPQVSADGTQLLIDQNSFWAIFDAGASASIDRLDIENNLVESYSTPGLHHPFTELSDGSLIWGATDGRFTEEILTVRSPDGDTQELWRCTDFVAAEGAEAQRGCGSNTLSYSPERGTVLYSFFSLETMVEVDLQTGETVRYFGHSGEDAWAFDPPESAFWWQHGGHYTEQGTLLVSSKGVDADEETVLIEYALDESAETLTEVFRFGDGEGLYGDVMGEADYTAGGNILHNYGSQIRLREITPDGQVAWDVGWDGEMMGRSTPLTDLYAFVSPSP